ncbi:MAG: FecR domain-containing protein [Prolixibacteraceae bacterium]|jgi:ferric-dicitrate binding protein FerR (iron transport regulator)
MAINRKYIDKVYGQKFSLQDQKNLAKYFEDNDQNEETRLIVKEQWEQFVPDTENRPNLDSVFYKLYYTFNNRKDSAQKSRVLFTKISQFAAILIVGLLIAAAIYVSSNRNASNQNIEFISQTGFRNQFRLPDGTSGWLGYGSKLIYHVNGDNQRIVDLDGLAFFNVSHRAKQPFIVKTPSNLNIEVLGTKFNVSSYSEDKSCEVVLEQGSVRLNLQNTNIGEMLPNERVIYQSENNSIEKSNVNAIDYVAWKDGKLILNDISLKETCFKLSQFYNVDFELQTKGIDKQKVRLVLEDENLEDALKLLTMILPVKYQIEKRKILNNDSYSKTKITIKNN